jgi:hypothetical protein
MKGRMSERPDGTEKLRMKEIKKPDLGRSKTRTVFSIPIRAIDVYPHFFSLCCPV